MIAICRLLIAVGRAVAPASLRDDWSREWRAELWYATAPDADAPPRGRLELIARCAGAVIHALWLRKEEWSVTVLRQDVQYALRSLRLRPGFAAVAILTLSLGIGANATVFSVIHGVLLKPLPYHEPERLVQIWETNPQRNWTDATVAPANLLDWQARQQSFEDLTYYYGSDTHRPGMQDATITGSGDPERVQGMAVSANFFSVLGAGPALGRTLRTEDAERDPADVVVLSDAFWQRRFGGRRDVMGTRILLNGTPHEVVGIMPPAFHVPGADADNWQPVFHNVPRFRQMRRPHWFRVIARLKPGVTIDQARADMTRIALQLEAEYPQTNTQMGVGLGPLHEWFVGDLRQALFAILGAVALVLLVACTNVAGLLLARASTRQQEMAIRVALGAGRVRLVRQMLTESLVLAALGAAGGLLVARGALGLLRALGPAGVARLDRVGIDGGVLAFVTAAAVGTALVFGLVPAWQAARSSGADRLKDGVRTTTGGSAWLRRTLIVGEVALSVMLLVGAGLLLRSFDRLSRVPPGIDPSQALTFRITLPQRPYSDDVRVAGFYSTLMDRLRALPGVDAAGGAVRLSLEGANWTGDLFVESRPEVWGRELRHKAITSGYLAAVRLPLLRGRDFDDRIDTFTAPRVVLVNQSLVRRYLGDLDPIGQRIAFSRPASTTRWVTIVGVVADEKQDSLSADVRPEVYDPQTQDSANTMSVVVRTGADLAALVPLVRRELAAVDPAVAMYDVRTFDEVVRRSLAPQRFALLAIGLFAAMALVLAMVGLYGTVAFAVTQRRREIGVRLALGANRPDVVRMILWDGVRLVLAGLAIGIGVAVAMSRTIAGFLYAVRPADPYVLMAVTALLALAGVAASYLPALRASRVDPALSLRAE